MSFYIFLLLLLPFGGAVGARLRYREWQAWAAWGTAACIAFIAMWAVGLLAAGHVFLAVAAVSGFGFVAPEVWEAFRAILRRPTMYPYLGGAAAVGGFIAWPGLFNAVVAAMVNLALVVINALTPLVFAILPIVVVLFGFRMMFRGFRSGRRR